MQQQSVEESFSDADGENNALFSEADDGDESTTYHYDYGSEEEEEEDYMYEYPEDEGSEEGAEGFTHPELLYEDHYSEDYKGMQMHGEEEEEEVGGLEGQKKFLHLALIS